MNTRLQQFITAENISQAQFADEINVARATVSHILAGRNKPGFDFIEGMSRRFPDLNLEWLITGKGRMYKSKGNVPSVSETERQISENKTSLFSELSENVELTEDVTAQAKLPENDLGAIQPVAEGTSIKSVPKSDKVVKQDTKTQEEAKATIKDISYNLPNNKRVIEKIIVFFNDNTFQEFSM